MFLVDFNHVKIHTLRDTRFNVNQLPRILNNFYYFYRQYQGPYLTARKGMKRSVYELPYTSYYTKRK